jgi:hypothetical protein
MIHRKASSPCADAGIKHMFLNLTVKGLRLRIAAANVTSYKESGGELEGNTAVTWEEGEKASIAFVDQTVEDIDGMFEKMFTA